jgi:hypothetical protein
VRRIDYIRQTASIPRNGLNAPPGENPYAVEFGILSVADTLRLWDKHITFKSVKGSRDTNQGKRLISKAMLMKYMKPFDVQRLNTFLGGDVHGLSRASRRRLSRVLLQMEAGQLVLESGRLVLYPEVEPPKPAMTYAVKLEVGAHNRLAVKLTPGAPATAPKQLPNLFRAFGDFHLEK